MAKKYVADFSVITLAGDTRRMWSRANHIECYRLKWNCVGDPHGIERVLDGALPLAKSIIQFVLQRYWRVSRGLLLSVAAVVSDAEGRVLFCRDATAATADWCLPRSDVLTGEDVEAALQRILADGGLAGVTEPATVFAIYADQSSSRAEHVAVLTARASAPHMPQQRGPIEWRWCAADELPSFIDPSSRRRIEEIIGARPVSETW